MVIRTINENNNVERNDGLKGKVVRNSRIARRLLDHIDPNPTNTLRIIDCKPDKSDPTHQRSVFVFEDNEKFHEVFSEVLDADKKSRSSEEDDLRRQMAEMQRKLDELTNKNNETKE